MGQLIGHREWETLYHGWNWADVVSDMGFVRDDGKTMIAQPHLKLGDQSKMWTLDHLRRMGPVQSPNVLFNEMTPEERVAFHAKYIKAGPGGPVPEGRRLTPGVRTGRARPPGPAVPPAPRFQLALFSPCKFHAV